MKEITEEQALNRLRAKVSYNVKIKDVAKEFGVSPAFMCSVMAGKDPMTENMQQEIGVERRIAYFATEE